MKLKHFLFVILLLFIANTAVFAQKVRFGIQAGGGVASAYNYCPDKNEYIDDVMLGIPKNYIVPSYSLNLYLSMPLNEQLAVAVEPGVIQKGFANKLYTQNDLFHNRYHLTYIQAPVLLEYSGVESPITFTIGPEFGYLLKARWKSDDGIDSDFMNYYKKNRIDVGLQFGAYYTYAEYLDLGLKIGGSFTDLEKFYLADDFGQVLTTVRKKATYINVFVRVKF